MDKDMYDLNIDISQIKNHEEYLKLWKKFGKIEVKMVEKHEQCRHEVGDISIYNTPYNKPEKLCNALKHVLDLYTWRVFLGFPSWNSGDRKVFKLHCPDPKGTVWEMRKIEE